MEKDNLGAILWVVLIALLLFGKNSPVISPAEKATAATYVYEKGDFAVPNPVKAALDKLNRERKIVATMFEDDTTDGDENVPEQYKVPLAAAKEAGLPSLVAHSGSKVLKVTKDPKTEEDVYKGVP